MADASNDGWTHVPNKGRKSRKDNVAIVSRLPPQMKGLVLSDLQKDFEVKRKIWEQSDARKQLHQILNRLEPENGWRLDKAVCLATGSLSRDNWENRKRSMRQLVVFMDIMHRVQGERALQSVFAQDPSYTDLDVDFLSQLGLIVLPTTYDNLAAGLADARAISRHKCGPAAEHFGPSSFVCEFFLDYDEGMMNIFLEAGIQLLLGTFAGAVERRNYASSSTLRADYSWYHFPRFEEDPNVFEGLDVFASRVRELEEI